MASSHGLLNSPAYDPFRPSKSTLLSRISPSTSFAIPQSMSPFASGSNGIEFVYTIVGFVGCRKSSGIRER